MPQPPSSASASPTAEPTSDPDYVEVDEFGDERLPMMQPGVNMPDKSQFNLPWKADELRRMEWDRIVFKRYKMSNGGFYNCHTESDDAAAQGMFGFKLVGIQYKPGVMHHA